MAGRTILVLGATGYVGGRLVPALVAAGHHVRAAARRPEQLADRPWIDKVEAPAVDALERGDLDAALSGVDVVIHLVHSMSGGDDFAELDRRIATNVAEAAAEAGIARIIYLGGLGSEADDLSDHLASRHEVGEVLRSGPVPVTEVRAAIVLGSGSASFEMLRGLTELLPVMVAPRWVNRTRCQPIAVSDLLADLVALVDERFDDADRTLDAGGPDVVTYRDMILTYAEVSGLRRRIVPVPVLTPRLSSHWVGLTTTLPRSLAAELVESLVNDVVVRPDHDISAVLPRDRTPMARAIEEAAAEVEDPTTSTRWSDEQLLNQPAAPAPWDPDWSGPAAYEDVRIFQVDTPRDTVFTSLTSIGGDRRWLVANALWGIRGLIDQLVGGVGLRRGRRHPQHLRVGDALDWWRVERIERPELLLLRAEMRMPGRGWLSWRLTEDGASTEIEQRATFVAKGLWGRAYWYCLLPFHGIIFPRLVQRIAADATTPVDEPELVEQDA